MASITYMSAAATACEERDWKITNLEVQKLLYLSHMKFMSLRNGEPLILDHPFEAWKYGPVISGLYHRLKPFGDGPVKDIFMVRRNPSLLNHRVITDVVRLFRNKKPFELVEMTHRSGGAWDLYYDPDISGRVIPNYAIRRDFAASPF